MTVVVKYHRTLGQIFAAPIAVGALSMALRHKVMAATGLKDPRLQPDGTFIMVPPGWETIAYIFPHAFSLARSSVLAYFRFEELDSLEKIGDNDPLHHVTKERALGGTGALGRVDGQPCPG